MKPPKCRLCGTEHWNSEPHQFTKLLKTDAATNNILATNLTATNDATNIPDATNRESAVDSEAASVGKAASDEISRMVVALESKSAKTANRRTREAYNAYQREYMRRRRGLR